MFNPFSAGVTAKKLEELLQSGQKKEDDARDSLLTLLRSSGYTSITLELRELLAFAIGYFSKCVEQEGIIGQMASTYSVLCANIANGHINI